MTPTIEAAKLIKRAANRIPYDIADMNLYALDNCMKDIIKALELVGYKKHEPLFYFKSVDVLNTFNELYPDWSIKSKSDKCRIPRHVLIYILKKYCHLSSTEIGYITNYDRSSIDHAFGVVNKEVDNTIGAYTICLHNALNKLKENATTKTDTTNHVAAVN